MYSACGPDPIHTAEQAIDNIIDKLSGLNMGINHRSKSIYLMKLGSIYDGCLRVFTGNITYTDSLKDVK